MAEPPRARSRACLTLLRCGLLAAFAISMPGAIAAGQSGQQPPSLRAETDLLTIDVQISPVHGAAIRPFGLQDFSVEVGGQKRTPVSVTMLHDDEGSVIRDLKNAPGIGPSCVFGFHRKQDLKTVHYVIGVEGTEADRRKVPRVDVRVTDKAFEIQWQVWRSPIRRIAAMAVRSLAALQ